MNWSEYKAKKGKTADFANKEVVTKKAVKEVKDSDITSILKKMIKQHLNFQV